MEFTKIEVQKVSLKDERANVEFTADLKGFDEDGKEVESHEALIIKSPNIVHADLKNALAGLKPHLVSICELAEANDIDDIYRFDPDQIENYEVTGYSIGGSDENAGVTIIGKKLLQNGKVLNIVVPFTKFEDEEGYLHCGALSSAIQACDYEIEQYLLKGKWGIKQAEFEFEEQVDEASHNEEAA